MDFFDISNEITKVDDTLTSRTITIIATPATPTTRYYQHAVGK